ncbi:hypothetical protein AHF37_01685 [Paragonimus kellicotti]|nr:hypothetical protein AHF37_01685 [Paragonimus kellicotti]
MPYTTRTDAPLLPSDARHKLQMRRRFQQNQQDEPDSLNNKPGTTRALLDNTKQFAPGSRLGVKRKYDSTEGWERSGHTSRTYAHAGRWKQNSPKPNSVATNEAFPSDLWPCFANALGSQLVAPLSNEDLSRGLSTQLRRGRFVQRGARPRQRDINTGPMDPSNPQLMLLYYNQLYQQYYKTYTAAANAAAFSLSGYPSESDLLSAAAVSGVPPELFALNSHFNTWPDLHSATRSNRRVHAAHPVEENSLSNLSSDTRERFKRNPGHYRSVSRRRSQSLTDVSDREGNVSALVSKKMRSNVTNVVKRTSKASSRRTRTKATTSTGDDSFRAQQSKGNLQSRVVVNIYNHHPAVSASAGSLQHHSGKTATIDVVDSHLSDVTSGEQQSRSPRPKSRKHVTKKTEIKEGSTESKVHPFQDSKQSSCEPSGSQRNAVIDSAHSEPLSARSKSSIAASDETDSIEEGEAKDDDSEDEDEDIEGDGDDVAEASDNEPHGPCFSPTVTQTPNRDELTPSNWKNLRSIDRRVSSGNRHSVERRSRRRVEVDPSESLLLPPDYGGVQDSRTSLLPTPTEFLSSSDSFLKLPESSFLPGFPVNMLEAAAVLSGLYVPPVLSQLQPTSSQSLTSQKPFDLLSCTRLANPALWRQFQKDMALTTKDQLANFVVRSFKNEGDPSSPLCDRRLPEDSANSQGSMSSRRQKTRKEEDSRKSLYDKNFNRPCRPVKTGSAAHSGSLSSSLDKSTHCHSSKLRVAPISTDDRSRKHLDCVPPLHASVEPSKMSTVPFKRSHSSSLSSVPDMDGDFRQDVSGFDDDETRLPRIPRGPRTPSSPPVSSEDDELEGKTISAVSSRFDQVSADVCKQILHMPGTSRMHRISDSEPELNSFSEAGGVIANRRLEPARSSQLHGTCEKEDQKHKALPAAYANPHGFRRSSTMSPPPPANIAQQLSSISTRSSGSSSSSSSSSSSERSSQTVTSTSTGSASSEVAESRMGKSHYPPRSTVSCKNINQRAHPKTLSSGEQGSYSTDTESNAETKDDQSCHVNEMKHRTDARDSRLSNRPDHLIAPTTEVEVTHENKLAGRKYRRRPSYQEGLGDYLSEESPASVITTDSPQCTPSASDSHSVVSRPASVDNENSHVSDEDTRVRRDCINEDSSFGSPIKQSVHPPEAFPVGNKPEKGYNQRQRALLSPPSSTRTGRHPNTDRPRYFPRVDVESRSRRSSGRTNSEKDRSSRGNFACRRSNSYSLSRKHEFRRMQPDSGRYPIRDRISGVNTERFRRDSGLNRSQCADRYPPKSNYSGVRREYVNDFHMSRSNDCDEPLSKYPNVDRRRRPVGSDDISRSPVRGKRGFPRNMPPFFELRNRQRTARNRQTEIIWEPGPKQLCRREYSQGSAHMMRRSRSSRPLDEDARFRSFRQPDSLITGSRSRNYQNQPGRMDERLEYRRRSRSNGSPVQRGSRYDAQTKQRDRGFRPWRSREEITRDHFEPRKQSPFRRGQQQAQLNRQSRHRAVEDVRHCRTRQGSPPHFGRRGRASRSNRRLDRPLFKREAQSPCKRTRTESPDEMRNSQSAATTHSTAGDSNNSSKSASSASRSGSSVHDNKRHASPHLTLKSVKTAEDSAVGFERIQHRSNDDEDHHSSKAHPDHFASITWPQSSIFYSRLIQLGQKTSAPARPTAGHPTDPSTPSPSSIQFRPLFDRNWSCRSRTSSGDTNSRKSQTVYLTPPGCSLPESALGLQSACTAGTDLDCCENNIIATASVESGVSTYAQSSVRSPSSVNFSTQTTCASSNHNFVVQTKQEAQFITPAPILPVDLKVPPQYFTACIFSGLSHQVEPFGLLYHIPSLELHLAVSESCDFISCFSLNCHSQLVFNAYRDSPLIAKVHQAFDKLSSLNNLTETLNCPPTGQHYRFDICSVNNSVYSLESPHSPDLSGSHEVRPDSTESINSPLFESYVKVNSLAPEPSSSLSVINLPLPSESAGTHTLSDSMSTSARPPRIPGATAGVARPNISHTNSLSDTRPIRLGSVASRESSYSPPADRKQTTRRPNKMASDVQPEEMNAALLRKLEKVAMNAVTASHNEGVDYDDVEFSDKEGAFDNEGDSEDDDSVDDCLLLLAQSSVRLPRNASGNTSTDHLPSSSSAALPSPVNKLLRLLSSGSRVISLKPVKSYVPPPKTSVTSVGTQTGAQILCKKCGVSVQSGMSRPLAVTKSTSKHRVCFAGIIEILPGVIALSRGISLRRFRPSLANVPSTTSASATTMRFRWPVDGEVVDCIETLPDQPVTARILPVICDSITAVSPRFSKTVEQIAGVCVSRSVICGPFTSKGTMGLQKKVTKFIARTTGLHANGIAKTDQKTALVDVNVTQDPDESDEESDGRRLRRHLRRTQKTQEINTAMVTAAMRQNELETGTESNQLTTTSTQQPVGSSHESEATRPCLNGAVDVPDSSVVDTGKTQNDQPSSRLAEARQRAKRFIELRKLSMQENAGHPQIDIDSEVADDARGDSGVVDDVDGHLIYSIGQFIFDRYEIIKTLGEGTFGKVVECTDHVQNRRIALKIIKNVDKYREAAMLEINVLNFLNERGANVEHLCVTLLDWFDYHGHICLAFDILGLSVFDFLKDNNYVGYPMEHVRHISYQLCHAVRFLHDNQLTHTDLKPENVLFVDSDYISVHNRKKRRHEHMVKCSDIRLIDFGSATFDYDHHSTIVSTRHYRAPEVILVFMLIGLGYCVRIQIQASPMPYSWAGLNRAMSGQSVVSCLNSTPATHCSNTGFFYHGRLDWDFYNQEGRYVRENCRPLLRYCKDESQDTLDLFDLMAKMLEYDPADRITLAAALTHPFFLHLPSHQRLNYVYHPPPAHTGMDVGRTTERPPRTRGERGEGSSSSSAGSNDQKRQGRINPDLVPAR